MCFYAFLQNYELLGLKYIQNGIEKYIEKKNSIENNVFCINKYRDINKPFNYFDIDSLKYVKEFLLKENSNNIYIFEDTSFSEEKYLELLKELALSNNEIVIVDTGNIEDIHRLLANKIINVDELEKKSF